MKKIGILFGMENTFPWAVIEKINSMGLKDIIAEPVHIDIVEQGAPNEYAVIIDRISQDVPFYRAYLKNAAMAGTAVINNPFWWSADEKFFNNAVALKVGVPVPKTVLLPSFERPADTKETSFRNLAFPLSWQAIFDHIGFPAYMKPHAGGGWKSVYKVKDAAELFKAYHETGQLVMMLQEEIVFEEYFRCYCLGQKYVRIMQYEPRNPHHLRYVEPRQPEDTKLHKTVKDYVLRLNQALGYDFNTVEFAVRDGIPYAIDFCNPAPDADVYSVGQENFDWVIEHAAKLAVERAQAHQEGKNNLTWGTFVGQAALGNSLVNPDGGKKTTSQKKNKSSEPLATIAPAESKAPKEVDAPTTEVVPQKGAKSKAKLVSMINVLSIDAAAEGETDDLKVIEGIGPVIEKKLNEIGIYTYRQLSRLTDTDMEKIDDALQFFPGRMKRDDWKGQAAELAKM